MSIQEAEELKNMGNLEYKRGNFASASEYYTKAINLRSNHSIYYSNRSLCHKNQGLFEKAIEDAQDAIELDEGNIKAHLTLGICLCELARETRDLNKVETSVKRMKKALSLCSSQDKRNLESSIQNVIYRARKLKFYLLKEDYESEAKSKFVTLQVS